MKTLLIAFLAVIISNVRDCSENQDKTKTSPDQYSKAEEKKESQTSTQSQAQPQTPVQPQQPAQPQMEQQTNSQQQAADPMNYRLTVSFYSKGEGTDYKTREEFDKFLEEFSPSVAVEKKRWGREGESDYCFKLSELTKAQQDDFVGKAKAILSKSQLVHIKENVPCRG